MKYGSVCSGIEAATVAWHELSWSPLWFSEIAPFPSQILAHHYPTIPNLGDMTKIYENKIFKENDIDLLVGGTPCQSFSIVGLRKGLDDPRGDLALEFLRLANIKKPRWIVWENVVGVLSSNKGKDFGSFLNSLGECGYGYAYRVLDSQYFGVPQRRRRVFVVGYCGGWNPAAQVLFEQKMLPRNFTKNAIEKKECSNFGSGDPKKYNLTAVDVYNNTDTGDIAVTFGANSGGTNTAGPKLVDQFGLRRFTPLESERLMGFPDNYTLILNASDTQRYKALGNSMVVPVMRWIGERIDAYEKSQLKLN